MSLLAFKAVYERLGLITQNIMIDDPILTYPTIIFLEYFLEENTGGYFTNSFEFNGKDIYIEPEIFSAILKTLTIKSLISDATQIEHVGGPNSKVEIRKSENYVPDKSNEICGFLIGNPNWIGIKKEINRLKLIQAKTEKMKNTKLSFIYEEYDKSSEGKLKISDIVDITFQKMHASILNFFYEATMIDNELRNYKDFNSLYAKNENVKNITSDSFSKKIRAINKRIHNGTSGLIKELILKEKSKSNKSNMYKWNKIY